MTAGGQKRGHGGELEHLKESLEGQDYLNVDPMDALEKCYDELFPGMVGCFHEWSWESENGSEGNGDEVLKPVYGKYQNSATNLGNSKMDADVNNRKVYSALKGLEDAGYIGNDEGYNPRDSEMFDFSSINLHRLAALHRDFHMAENGE